MLIATSSCLLGNKVRYDGSSKNNKFILRELIDYCDFEAICPEDLAFGTPRPTIQIDLGADKNNPQYRAVVSKTGEDVTDPLLVAINKELERLKTLPIAGIILKSKSPSCGLGSCRYYRNGAVVERSHGLFAKACVEAFPELPIEEEARLNDAWLRENFVMRIFAYEAMRELAATITGYHELVDFHTNYKFLLQSKHELNYRELGNIVANHDKLSLEDVVTRYQSLFNQTIAERSSIKKTTNVLEHMLGFFKKDLDTEDKAHILGLMDKYREKTIPLVAITEVFKLFAKKYEKTFLLRQCFLNPYPESLALRSNILAGR